jgi:hypothetical protein
MTDSPKPKRLRFHVWLTPHEDGPTGPGEPVYQGVVDVRNVDQLRAENAARSVGVTRIKDQPFHLTNLWIWQACIRLGLTDDRFDVFTSRLDYDPIKADQEDDDQDPTRPHQGPNSG